MSQPRTIYWKEYPYDQPIRDGYYLVTLESGQVTTRYYCVEKRMWIEGEQRILAYSDFPEPFEPEVDYGE